MVSSITHTPLRITLNNDCSVILLGIHQHIFSFLRIVISGIRVEGGDVLLFSLYGTQNILYHNHQKR
jgi:hypothetical protein